MMMNLQPKLYIFCLFLFALLESDLVLAQNFGGPGSQWYYNGHNAAPPEYSGYFRFSHVGDTLIENYPTNTLLMQVFSYTGNSVYEVNYYVRQSADTAFLYDDVKSRFIVFYIFNRYEGDTLTLEAPGEFTGFNSTYRVVIQKITSVKIDGVELLKYKVKGLDDYTIPIGFMDRIGPLSWFFPTPNPSFPEGPGDIRCYSDMLIDTNFNNYACDYHLISGVSDIDQNATVDIFPNPVQQQLTINASQPIERAALYDLSGELMLSTVGSEIDCSNLPNGCYQLTVQLQSGIRIRRNIVKLD